VPVPGDYDGDGVTDPAVFTPSSGAWSIRLSTMSFTTSPIVAWGANGDIPVPGDYDGDGKTDLAIYRPSTGVWYLLPSLTGTFVSYAWGASTDVPVLKRP
jgi:hypothetical protein